MDDPRVLITYIFEGVSMTVTGLALIGFRLKMKNAVLVGIIYALAIYFVRGMYTIYDIPFGTHTIILIGTMIFLMRFVAKIPLGLGTVGALLSLVLLVLSETIIGGPVLKLMGLSDFSQVLASPWRQVTFGVVAASPLAIIGMFCYVTKFSLINFNNSRLPLNIRE